MMHYMLGLPTVRRWAKAVAGRWQQARQRRATRRYIMAMDEHMLADLGVSRAQALFEIEQGRRSGLLK
jgi:uncharacterized protein YjiS (DUF1127 family)